MKLIFIRSFFLIFKMAFICALAFWILFHTVLSFFRYTKIRTNNVFNWYMS